MTDFAYPSIVIPARVTWHSIEAVCPGLFNPAVAVTREQMHAVHNLLRQVDAVELPTKHYFAGGMYCREGIIPQGTIIVGKVHKTDHFIMVLKGRITVWSETGRVEIAAPFIGVCPAGSQRMGLTHEDTTFVNVHRTDKTTLTEAEADLVEDDPTSVYGLGNMIKKKPMPESHHVRT